MSLARNITTVGSATLLSRLLGFLRDVGIAAMLGAGVVSDAFFAVLQIINFFRRLLAEGALNAAFVPMWLRIKQAEGERGAYRFLYDVLRAMALAVVALALIGLLLAPAVIGLLAPGFDGERHALAADYLHIAAPYVALAGVGRRHCRGTQCGRARHRGRDGHQWRSTPCCCWSWLGSPSSGLCCRHSRRPCSPMPSCSPD